jgi:hypothetical protein
MAFEDTNCPCGGKKLQQTMLCEECWSYLRSKLSQEVAAFENTTLNINARRDAAIRLLRMARLRPKPIKLHAFYD